MTNKIIPLSDLIQTITFYSIASSLTNKSKKKSNGCAIYFQDNYPVLFWMKFKNSTDYKFSQLGSTIHEINNLKIDTSEFVSNLEELHLLSNKSLNNLCFEQINEELDMLKYPKQPNEKCIYINSSDAIDFLINNYKYFTNEYLDLFNDLITSAKNINIMDPAIDSIFTKLQLDNLLNPGIKSQKLRV